MAELRSVFLDTLNSRASRASALIRLNYRDGYALRYDQIIERTTKLDVNAACNDPVTLILKQKDSGASRPTLQFGWRHRARQLMLRDVVYAAGICNEFDFNFRDHGPQRAIDRMVEAVGDGFHFWLTADIKNCFASVKLEHLLGMVPLSGRILKGVAFLPASVPIQCSHTQESITYEQDARRGLPQGSMASGPLASAFLGREIRLAIAGHQGVVVVIFADDIAIGARTQAQIETIEVSVGERLASLSGGPLFLKYANISHANAGIDFIQRHILRRQWDGKWSVKVQPSWSAFRRLDQKLLSKFGNDALVAALEASNSPAHEFIRRWAAAMNWRIQPEWEDTILLGIVAHS